MNNSIPVLSALGRLTRWALLLVVAWALATPAWAGSGPGGTGATPSLAEALNPDGTLLSGLSGTFNPSGFRMRTGPDGRPVFKAAGITGAGDEKWQDGFGLPGVNGTVNAVATNGTEVYVGGNFSITAAGTVVARYIAKWDGTAWSSLGTGTSGNVQALALSGSTLYVGGSFSQAGGITVNSLARWNGTAWSSMGGANGTVYALAVSGTDLYAAGAFTAIGSVGASRVARWNGSAWSALGTGVNDEVRALAVSGSVVYAGGSFSTAGGASASRVARWSGTAWSSMGAGVNGTVYALAISGTSVYAGGTFSTAGAVTASNIARWTGGTTWTALGAGVNSYVYSLTIIGADLYVGGSFYQAGGLSASYIARWSGTAWATVGNSVNGTVYGLTAVGTELYAGGSFTAAGGVGASRVAKWNGAAWSRFGAGFTSDIYAIAVHGPDVYVGGDFTTAGSVAASRVARWNGSSWSSLGTGINGTVFALAVDSNGSLYAGGDFTQAGGLAAGNIAKWNGNAWSAVGSGTNFSVRALLAQGLEVYAGGQFNQAGGVNTGPLAKWNGNAWSGVGGSLSGSVFALALSGSNLYAGGMFSLAGGSSTVQVARWNGSAWAALGNTLNGTAYALAVAANGTVYAGGDLGINSSYVRNLAKWNGTAWTAVGNAWSQLSMTGTTGMVYSLAIVGPALYIGGMFTAAGGSGAPADYIAKWDGTSWSSLGTGLNSTVTALAGSGGNVLHAGGSFTTVGDGSKVTAYYGEYDATSPALTGINPMSGPVGQTVTISGWDLTGATAVSFNGTNAPGFTVSGDGHTITVNVPTGATNGPISITLPGGTLTSSGNFILMSTGTPTTFQFAGPNPFVQSTGYARAYQVPAGVTQLQVVAQGATGGFDKKGGRVEARIAVVPGEYLTVVVGGRGTIADYMTPNYAGPGGFNGGGAGGSASSSSGYGGQGGGGATDIRRISGASSFDPLAGSSLSSTINNRLVIAGGAAVGADAGTSTGSPWDGGAGTTSSGGSGGANGSYSGYAGSLGEGGSGGNGTYIGSPGGGGGYYGGGGAASSSGYNNYNAGGGSSYAMPTALVAGTVPVYSLPASAVDAFLTVTPYYNLPAIASFTPSSGGASTSVTITGSYFSGATSVAFNGTNAPGFTVNGAGTQITVTVPAGATTGPISVTTASGTTTSSTSFTVGAVLAISSFTPASGPVGTSVTITGSEFTGATAVAFNGTAASFTVNSATQITATVAAGTTSGTIRVTTPGGTATSTGSFTVIPAPAIASFTPASGPVGTSVTITGTSFSGATAVAFNGTAASSFTVNSATSITATLAAGTTTGAISVTTPGGTATSTSSFTVIPAPVIASFSPGSGPVGQNVVLSGSNFSGATAVTFNGTNAPAFTVSSATSITVSVPSGATSGPISVTTPGGTATSSTSFTVNPNPVVYSFSPASGPVGTSVVITGDHFLGVQFVTFNTGSSMASFVVNSATQITATVPAGATTGPIGVNTGGSTAFSATAFTVTTLPLISSFAPTSGPVGTVVTINGNSLTGASAVRFNGTAAASFTVNSATQITATVAAGTTTGTISVTTPSGTATSTGSFTVTVPAPTIASFTPASGPVGTSVNISGSNFSGATAVRFNGTAASSFAVNSAISITAVVPAGAGSGTLSVTTAGGTATSTASFTVTVPDLTVSTAQAISGTYNNVTITGTGTATLGGPLRVNGTLTVQGGGQLLTACERLTGAGSFVLQAGATLGICNVNGISLSDTTGAVQVSGMRSYSNDALYLYNGTVAQATGPGLPAQVRELIVSTTGGNLTLTNSLAIAQVLRITTPDFNYGNLDLGGRTLTLRSSAAGTALIHNDGNGSVLANTGTCRMERYITPSLNPGAGYRHFSSPIPDMTIGQLATTGFTPVLNQAYNTSATPTSVTPFPNVFGYDQTRLSTATNNLDAFSKGWVVPTASTPMAPAHGYTVHVPASAVLTFTGSSFNQGQPGRFISPGRGPQADAGWVLVGNPYPSPFDLSVPGAQARINLDAANYVFESTSTYGGQYRAFVNGIGSGSPLLAAGQGFFVRMSVAGQNSALSFARGGRLTSFASQVPFRRGTADTRPQVALRLQAAGLSDVAHVYAEAGATPQVDAAFDAVKMANPSGLNLATLSGTEQLAIDGRPALTAGTVLPLTVQVPSAGAASFTAVLSNLPAGLTAYLHDAATGTRQDLGLQPAYSFTAGQAGTMSGRFALVFGPANGLLGTASAQAAALALYPNPARSQATLTLLAQPAARVVRLHDALGRAVREQLLPAGAHTAVLDLGGLSTGLYTVRCGAATAKLVVE
ncbi:hypothetical protein GCM10023185_45910 [Hymenobacter saemangeumensis]|uniref:IPT/TIG domain-containing protein n=1 Tax=Hymenobacter saemangeumensis TaxID=1084522 RepID=A0ABP8IT02_9BACT